MKEILDTVIAATGISGINVYHRPGLLSDHGPSCISSELRDYLSISGMGRT